MGSSIPGGLEDVVMAVVIGLHPRAPPPPLESRCLSPSGAAVTEFCRSGRSGHHRISYLSSFVRASFCLGTSHLLSETPNPGFFFKKVLEGRSCSQWRPYKEKG